MPLSTRNKVLGAFRLGGARLDFMRAVRDTVFTIAKTLKRPWLFLLFACVSVAVILIAIWLPNLNFLRHVVTTPNYTVEDRTAILLTSFGTLQTNFSPLSRWTIIIVALLTGVNVALFAHYVQTRRILERSAGVTALGTLLGMLGVGCAACGSVIVSSLLGVSATAALVGALPLRGVEFGFVGMAVLFYANYALAKKIRAPLACDLS